MLIDSHCHLNHLDLTDFNGRLENALTHARSEGVGQFLCVCISPKDMPEIEIIADTNPDVLISAGIHPNEVIHHQLSAQALTQLAKHPQCVAMGETGLDYYRTTENNDILNQQHSFKTHIQVAKDLNKPLIIHTRHAAKDTIRIMREEQAENIGGVMHCFAEDLETAYAAIDLNFYISFSGIVTFKNAKALQEVAQKIPLDRILIETDAPYLAPTPNRGKPNHPAWVKYVAKHISILRNTSIEHIEAATTENFYSCFRLVNRCKNSL